MYGIAGERRLEEYELDWLPGYEGSRPVRVGNAAAGQFQIDVYGEVLGAGWAVAMAIGQFSARRWTQLRRLMDYLETVWREPDDGMWEARGPRRHYTQSKLMAWVAFDRSGWSTRSCSTAARTRRASCSSGCRPAQRSRVVRRGVRRRP